ncbi:MAG: hypothetical protein NT027_19815 [Proteobacteria bacterium]|nr:hypothetical protein [Pseudomonadota bacterium]
MALGFKTGGRDWLPGQSGNAKGRPRAIDKEIESLSGSLQLERKISRLLVMSSIEILEVVKDLKSSPIDLMLARMIIETGKSGCPRRLEFLLKHWKWWDDSTHFT